MDKILVPKYRKGKKPTRVRKPSRPLDGINHRLLKEQAAQAEEVVDTPPTREELETKATELGITFTTKTTDAKLLKLITKQLEN